MLEAAGRLTTRFEDGVWLAELAPLADPAGIAPEIARALGAPEVAGRAALSPRLAQEREVWMSRILEIRQRYDLKDELLVTAGDP